MTPPSVFLSTQIGQACTPAPTQRAGLRFRSKDERFHSQYGFFVCALRGGAWVSYRPH